MNQCESNALIARCGEAIEASGPMTSSPVVMTLKAQMRYLHSRLHRVHMHSFICSFTRLMRGTTLTRLLHWDQFEWQAIELPGSMGVQHEEGARVCLVLHNAKVILQLKISERESNQHGEEELMSVSQTPTQREVEEGSQREACQCLGSAWPTVGLGLLFCTIALSVAQRLYSMQH
eukprot:5266756-Amphidinium_carterae.1